MAHPIKPQLLGISLIAVLVCVGACQPVRAFEDNRLVSREAGDSGKMGFLKQLNLTEDQKQKLHSLFEANRPQRQQARQALKEKRERLMQMMQSGSGSQEEALSLQRELAKSQEAMMSQHIQTMYQVKNILTPAQFEQFKSIMAEKREQFKNRRGNNSSQSDFGPGASNHLPRHNGF